MAKNISQVELAPYLNPNHWDGHMLGVGGPITDFTPPPILGEIRYARTMINTRVRSGSVVPLQTFDRGDIFNPADYLPGTVVLFRQEELYGKPVDRDYNLDELASQEIPARPTGTSPSFGPNTPRVKATDGKRHYVSSVRWGVVPKTNSETHLCSTPAGLVREEGVGVRALSGFASTRAPVRVGETMHYPRQIVAGMAETLHRVNILYVVAHGTPERQKSRVFFPLGKAALGGLR